LRVRVGVTVRWAYITNKMVTCSKLRSSCDRAHNVLSDVVILDLISSKLWSALVCVVRCICYSTPTFSERNQYIDIQI
jgi:hypothetical protein